MADRDTITIAEAGKLWLTSCEVAGHERTTLSQYRQHLNLHISPTSVVAASTRPQCRSSAPG